MVLIDFDDYDFSNMKSIEECLAESIDAFDKRFQKACRDWPLVRRNKAITARNRMMADVGVSLGIPYVEMELEGAEA